jgi:GNAT superfamily N-acetyltransferase
MLSFLWEDEFFWGPQDPDAGYMRRLAVRHGCHGEGLGAFAIEWCVQRVLGEGRRLLRLDCDPRNTKLCAYYESQGFRRVMTRRIERSGDYVASLYEKRLA